MILVSMRRLKGSKHLLNGAERRTHQFSLIVIEDIENHYSPDGNNCARRRRGASYIAAPSWDIGNRHNLRLQPDLSRTFVDGAVLFCASYCNELPINVSPARNGHGPRVERLFLE